MDFGGLQALRSDSDSSEEDSSNQSLNDSKFEGVGQPSEKSNQETKTDFESKKKDTENLYELYKKGLQSLASKEYDSANKIFDSILINPLIANAKFEEADEIEKDLQKLKYVSLKNLSLIQNEHTQNFKFALEYLIQAATIDGTDINLWYEIGCLSLKIGRLIVAKVSFEECLNINARHWPSLDQLIVILFSLGNFTYSLKLVFDALRIDKAYINGLIVLKKIEFLKDSELNIQVKKFLHDEYIQCGIDVDEILDQAPEHLYDDLMNRVSNIKIFSAENVSRTKQITSHENEAFIEISTEITNWKFLGDFIMATLEEGRFNLLEKFTIKIKVKETNDELLNSNDSKKNDELTKENDLENDKSKKRKQKFDYGNIEEGWWKRRSLRKGIEKNDQNDKNIGDILKNFFSEQMLCDIKTIMTPSKKSSFSEKMMSQTIRLLEEDEREQVGSLISNLTISKTSLFDIIKLYLNRLALNYNRLWYEALDDVFICLFDCLNEQIDLIELLNENGDLQDFSTMAPIIICYLELKFSNYKLEMESQVKPNSNEENLDKSFEQRNSKMERLIFYTIEFENLCERKLKKDYEKNSNCDQSFIRTLLARIYSLNLFASCNFHYLDLSSEYYEQKTNNQLEDQKEIFIIGISKIFPVISKESIREFLKQSKKNNIFKMNNRIEKFFKEENYQLIIESLQDFAETHKLPLDNSKFNPRIFYYFIQSWMKKSFPDEIKCAYFCRKFLKDCIHYLKEEIRNLTQNHNMQTESNENDGLEKFNYLSEISTFIYDLLDVLYLFSNKKDVNSDFESENVTCRETIWLMNQIISIYFDTSNDLALKLDLKNKPLKAFFLLFDIIEKKNSKLNTMEFIMLVHEYLARNGFCGCNSGEFLIFSIEKLIKFKSECEFCSNKTNFEIETEKIDEETTKSDKTSTKSSDDEKNICFCLHSDELLEQMFYCLFGFRKKSAKNLKNHSRIVQKLDSNNCWNLYFFYQPNKIIEYDDLAKFSITSEIYDLMREILVLITCPNIDEELDKCTEQFFQKANETGSMDEVLDHLSTIYNKEQEIKFKDIYYFLGDYKLKIEKENDQKNRYIYNYFIKDLVLNKNRVDSWASLALHKSSKILLSYTESIKLIKSESQMNEFKSDVELCITLFKKASQYRRPNDHTILLEFGLFVYQISSFTSRLLRMNRLVGFLENDKIKKELEAKKNDYLELAYEAYQQLFSLKDVSGNLNQETSLNEIAADESSTASSSSYKKMKLDQNEQNFEELWLQNYMLGKIKEKKKGPIMESLKHYKRAYEILDKNIFTYLKKITYKSKSCYNLEANEMFYRIYALTLKRLENIAARPNCEQELSELSNFLESLVETRFVKAHNDFDLDEISIFLNENVFSLSKKLNNIQHKDLFLNCVCICVTGLGQILKRFSQHYRSLYRLAYFYTKFLDFQNLEVSKNLLLGNSLWNSLTYMPCSGYFQEKNRANFYYGIWKISSNTNEEQEDFERAESFSNHLFKATVLLIEVLEKSGDRFNLLEMSKMFYQKMDAEKKYLNNDMMREYIADKSISSCYKNVERETLESFKKTFNITDMTEFSTYQNSLIPLLLDSFEIYKLALKNNEKTKKYCENLLIKLYLQFNPEAISRITPITIDEIIKFCLLIEKKEKINKVKTKSRYSLSAPIQPGFSSNQ